MITLYGVTEDGTSVPVQVNDEGKIIAIGQQGPPGQDSQVPGPPGPPGPQGEYGPGDDVELGNITAGTASFVGGRSIFKSNGNLELINGSNVVAAISANDGSCGFADGDLVISGDGDINMNGSITAAGSIISGNLDVASGGARFNPDGNISIRKDTGDSLNSYVLTVYSGGTTSNRITTSIDKGGAISAASNKCGFTADGDIYFTSRGDRFRIIVQQGICYADPYTREIELREKAEKLRQPKTQDIVPPTE